MVKREREIEKEKEVCQKKEKKKGERRIRRRRREKIGFFKDGSCDSWGLYTFRLPFWFNYDIDLLSSEFVFFPYLELYFVALTGFKAF